jgi:hypothetical protein
MPNDVDPLFRALAEDADRARLDAPADLRRRGDRRTAVGAVVGAVAVAVVVAGVLAGGAALSGKGARDLTPVDPASPTVTVSKSPAAPITTIPASARLTADDLNDSADPITSDALPGPCMVELPGSVLASATVQGFYRDPSLTSDYVPDGTVHQLIQVVDGVGGDGLRMECSVNSVKSVGPRVDATRLYRVRSEVGGAVVDSWFVVGRVGRAVSVLWVQGWEGTSASREDARRLGEAATARLHAWLD